MQLYIALQDHLQMTAHPHHCITLRYTLHWITSNSYIALHGIKLLHYGIKLLDLQMTAHLHHCITLLCLKSLHYIAQHCIALYFIAFHCVIFTTGSITPVPLH